jgi:excisionase family DNA binding protein
MQAQTVRGPQPASAGEDRSVLMLDGVAELLAVEPEVVAELAARGELPGRRIGGAWRFARAAVLDWLAAPPEPRPGRGGERAARAAPSRAESGE